MKYDHDAEPPRPSDTLPSVVTAELLRCVSRSLMELADQMDRKDHKEPTRPTQRTSEDDAYNF
jgi:hypothetical protein